MLTKLQTVRFCVDRRIFKMTGTDSIPYLVDEGK